MLGSIDGAKVEEENRDGAMLLYGCAYGNPPPGLSPGPFPGTGTGNCI